MPAAGTSRRDFLKSTGALIVSFSMAGALDTAGAQTASTTKPVALDEVDSFLTLASTGRVTVYTGKVDLGTGTRTSLRQIVAEELDVPLDWITLIEGDTARTPDQGPTWGSLTIQVGGVQIRQAAATARRALVTAAAERLGATAGDLEVKYGVVRLKSDPTKSVAYAELVGDREFRIKVDKSAPLKDPATYTVVGTSAKRGDAAAAMSTATKKLSATYEFAIHLHGSIGPSCAVADFKDGQLMLWSASQAPHWLRRELATMLGIPADRIRVQYLDGAGCY